MGKKVSKKTGKKTMKVGDFCRKAILAGRAPEKIIAKAKEKFPKSKVDGKHISWYSWDMKQESSKHYNEEFASE